MWEFWIDRGGTFTDIVARAPDGALHVKKLLSQNPERYPDAAIAGIRELAGEGAAVRMSVKMGTTVATNALLERAGAPTLLAITKGFADALRLGWQSRPDIFALDIRLPAPLYAEVVQLDERVDADGRVLAPLNEAKARADLKSAYAQGLRAIAIVCMHGWRAPKHEKRVAEIAREIGFTQISVSHEVAALNKLVARGDTTVADAYLSPVLRTYVDQVAGALPKETQLSFMQSHGGLVAAEKFRGKDAVLSGPAGGVVGMAEIAREAGFDRVIGFDMGGTSTDVSHFAGEFERTYESMLAGVRIQAPMLAIHTIASGGGSICRFDGARFRVGPDSAGAVPGPASYRRGGPLTITDCNVMLGKIQPGAFPAVFGPAGNEPLDRAAAERAFVRMSEEIQRATSRRMSPEEIAEGFLAIAVEDMAEAIKRISVERGHDVTKYTLVAFGGAAGQHACMVADAIGAERVLIHPLAGVLSAYGMGRASLSEIRERTIEQDLTPTLDLDKDMEELEKAARKALAAQGATSIRFSRRALLKYSGMDAALPVDFAVADMRGAYEKAHKARFGFSASEKAVRVEALQVEATAPPPGAKATLPEPQARDASAVRPRAHAPVRMGGVMKRTPLFDRDALPLGVRIEGPAIICEAAATTIVEPGWRARVDRLSNLVLERAEPLPARKAVGVSADPVMLEIFNNRFMAVAEQMGLALQSTAHSVNIKERLDFSCALFDAQGGLIANAPHIPVHLGSMGESVRAILRGRAGKLKRGDVFMLNAPYNGGTHLPDLTVIRPVFLGSDKAPFFFTAARGHHADIGGVTPGSMPPLSRTIEEEGVLIDDFLLVESGKLREEEARALLASGRYPARNVNQNIADLVAQVAACAKGEEELARMIAAFGRDVVTAYARHVQDNAEENVKRVIDALKDSDFAVEMDDGARISVKVRVARQARRVCIDFTGASPQSETNFNAPLSVTRAAVLYVFRTLVADDIPLNEGCLRPIEIVAPEGTLLNPKPPAAVVAGNVETSQAIVDCLYGALGVMAAAQGTMNNFTFGDATLQYYETIAGGAGAGADFDGASGVQTHMTNSRLTDPEVLEARFPVLVETFELRKGSGGQGRHKGGDGVRRRIRFRKAMQAAILSNRRRAAPFGLAGGDPGARGRNAVERADGRLEELSGTAEVQMEAGDAFLIETPGGGGFGKR
ncbi:MAG: hydantoinase B/oxoprolinase family protein [Hyphomonadaceae bacterium]|nr:hydantoinase B/oxoprolinase family protein [Hyphomonadaceae bacterium]